LTGGLPCGVIGARQSGERDRSAAETHREGKAVTLAERLRLLVENSPVERLVREVGSLPEGERSAAVERLFDHSDPGIRCDAIRVAHRLGHPRTVEFCTRSFADPVWHVRCAACEAAYLAPLAVPAEALLGLVEADEHEIVRFYAALALGRAGDERHVLRMVQLADVVTGTNHEDVTVRDCLLRSAAAIRERGLPVSGPGAAPGPARDIGSGSS
jgi:hypothetical protein